MNAKPETSRFLSLRSYLVGAALTVIFVGGGLSLHQTFWPARTHRGPAAQTDPILVASHCSMALQPKRVQLLGSNHLPSKGILVYPSSVVVDGKNLGPTIEDFELKLVKSMQGGDSATVADPRLVDLPIDGVRCPVRAWRAVPLAKGRALVIGGIAEFPWYLGGARAVDCTWIVDQSGEIKPGPRMTWPRHDHTATVLQDGRILIVGGIDNANSLRSCEIYDPKLNRFHDFSNLHKSRFAHAATQLGNGDVLIAGGFVEGCPLRSGSTVEVVNLASHQSVEIGSSQTPRFWGTLVPCGKHEAVFLGGMRFANDAESIQTAVDDSELLFTTDLTP